MAVTLKDIAKATGVNDSTVSHALKNDAYAQRLRQETRERIRKVAHEMGYRSNLIASAMRTGRNQNITFINDFSREQTAQILSDLLESVTKHGFGLKLYSDVDLDYTFGEILRNQLHYIISVSMNPEKRKQIAVFANRHHLKLVFIYEKGYGHFPAFITDNFKAISDAANYLYSIGHRRISFLCQKHNAYASECVRERHNGYVSAIRELGLPLNEKLIYCGNDTEEGILPILQLPEKERPTAFLCFSPGVMFSATYMIYNYGFRVPEDFSLMTFESAIPHSNEYVVVNLDNPPGRRSIQFRIRGIQEPHSEVIESAVDYLIHGKTSLSPNKENCYAFACQINSETVGPTVIRGPASQTEKQSRKGG
ncbi:MAG: HTH-type transcriptional repressor CytR [Lentisphaerae bacterium ADurb.Bin242]|nr:MAG: HTH-type transcriptional repressor CytR [Lentisphaerae bacterium ADurb.Bin242]